MCEVTYDIIDWKSCKSGSELGSSPQNSYDINGNNPNVVLKASGGSNSDHIVFPTLFYEDGTETSIVTLPDTDSDCWRSGTHEGVVPDDIEQLSVYQKVANWVSTQKGFFRKDEELVIEDDDLAVIDPVDLFQRSVLDEYLLIAEDDLERRAIIRDLNDVRCDTNSLNSKSLTLMHDDVAGRQKNLSYYHRYDIESVHELMQAHDYKFIREPKGDVELELEQIIEYGNNEMAQKTTKSRFRKKEILTSAALDVEEVEEKILFLGVPRLLENYVILNREGYVVKPDQMPDLWLSPFEEDLPNSPAEPGEANMSELEFLSSWFSDVYRTDDNTMERRETTLTDMLEKLTVITVGSDEEVWQDAPEIPHWLDDEQEELELFNQPSRPLYYYRDRIKGCYRIIGVEDETVVLFSGNDDDTIFYTEEDSFNPIMNSSDERSDNVSAEVMMTKLMNGGISYDPRQSFVSRYRRIYNRLRYGIKDDEVNDAKNDSGIDEDIDENACDDLQLSPYSLFNKEKEGFAARTNSQKRPSFAISINPKKESFIECLFVVMGAIIVLITLVLYKNNSPLFQMYRSKITEEVFDELGLLISSIFK